MDVPVVNLILLFVLALVGLAIVMGVVARAFHDHRRGLGYAIATLFVLAWVVHLFTGWQEFVAEQAAHGELASVWGEDGYAWTWLARSFENIMSEFLQLAAFVVLTSFLIFEGSAESKDSDERLEAKVDAIRSQLEELQKDKRAA
jgi:Na+/proline symporter